MAIGDDPNDPLSVVQRMQQGGRAFTFPAVNQITRPGYTPFTSGARPGQPAYNPVNQIPVGGFGLGALSQAGYSRSPRMNLGNFLTPTVPQQPTLTGYHWYRGTGGVSGGNNDLMRQYYSNGTMASFTGGVQDNQPLAPTIWTQPGINQPGTSGPYSDVRALSDPSVGALENAQRTTNQYGQQVINPTGGGQIISGRGPSFGSLSGSTVSTNQRGQQVLNTPSGGQAIGGPSLRKPQKMTMGQTWSLGGWY